MLYRRFASLFVYLAIAALTLLAGCDVRDFDRGPTPARTSAAHHEDAPIFAPGQLERHFRKHGEEMGFATQEEYLHAAQALVRGGPGVETLRRDGGDTLFYKERTNEFAVLSGRNVIRTYFRPDDGRRYWERQKRR